MEVSVVIPVYNGEKYLRECVDSILSQSYVDFEIILVDDGSQDSSGAICDEYASMHNNVHVFHQENCGNTQTRKRGVHEANGKWVTFVDADDSLMPYALEKLYEVASNTDLVIGFPDNPVHKTQLSLQECQSSAITGKLFPPAPWAKLYRKTLLTDDVFNFAPKVVNGVDVIKNKGGEDMLMNIRVMFKLTRVPHFVFEKIYNYRRNAIGITKKKKASLLHEAAYDELRIASIPPQVIGNYMHDIIYIRLNGLIGPASYESELMCNKNHPYLKRLREDIKAYSYSVSFQEWMLLNIPFAWMYKFFAFGVKVKNFLRYRMGLSN